jgi:hypothetical protein
VSVHSHTLSAVGGRSASLEAEPAPREAGRSAGLAAARAVAVAAVVALQLLVVLGLTGVLVLPEPAGQAWPGASSRPQAQPVVVVDADGHAGGAPRPGPAIPPSE